MIDARSTPSSQSPLPAVHQRFTPAHLHLIRNPSGPSTPNPGTLLFSLRCPLPTPDKPRSVPLPLSGPTPALDPAVWYAGGLDFECTQCGNCCSGAPGYVWLTLDDMHRIAAYLQLPYDEFTRTYVRKIGNKYSLTEKFNYDCSFLTRDAKGKAGCSIYSVRPMQCRTWPFWNENLKAPANWKGAGVKCPGIKNPQATHYDLPHIEKCRQHPESP